MRTKMKKPTKRVIDWKGIERDFRAGKTSIRQIAEWYEVSEGAIRKRAKAENWSQLQRPDDSVGTFRKLALIPAIQSEQEARAVFSEGKSLVLRMLDELGATTSLQGELEDFILDETRDDKDGRRRTAMMRSVDLPNRAKTLKDLMLAAKTAVEVARMERADGTVDVSPKADGTKPADDWDRLLN
jgi:hypothetical protein